MAMVSPNRQWIWLFTLVLITVSQLSGYAGSSEAGPALKKIVFKNVNVVPMNRETVLYSQDVVVHDDKIAAIYPTQSGKTPVDTEIIDGNGKWLLPGLADMHMHISPQWLSADWPVNPLKLYLANGVTTVRCFGPKRDQNKTTGYLFTWRKKISEGKLHGPVIYSCGPILYGPVKNPAAEIKNTCKSWLYTI
jgi:imidazolonepropionase-like amidohydrolase